MEKEKIIEIVLDELEKRNIITKSVDLFADIKSLFENFYRIENALIGVDKRIKKLNKSKNSITLPKLKKAGAFVESVPNNLNLDEINNQILIQIQTEKNISVFLDYIREMVKDNLNPDEADMIQEVYLNGKTREERKEVICSLADKYHYDESTVYKKINKALRSLTIEIFPEKYIKAIYY